MWFSRIASVFTIGLVLTVGTPANADEFDAGPIIANVVTKAIRPGFAKLAANARAAHLRVSALCGGPGDAPLMAARSAFTALVESWGRVEMVRPGPLAVDNRLERMLFWPDRRGRGLKQVRDVVHSNDKTAQSVDGLAQKSVAVQGLLALEFNLFGSGADDLATPEGAGRCAYASAITSNISNITAEIEASWASNEPGSISSLWLNPSPDNPLFRDGREQLSALFKILGDGFEIVRVQRIAPFLNKGFESVRPKSALFWRSANMVRSLRANIDGMQTLVQAADLQSTVPGRQKRVIESLIFEFKNAQNALSLIDKSPARIAERKADYDKLAYASVVMVSLKATIDEQLLPAFNLSAGFSSLDGD